MNKLKKIAIKIKDRLFQIKIEEQPGRIWCQWKGKIFVLYPKDIEKTKPAGVNPIHLSWSEHSGPKTSPIKKKDKYLILSPMPGEIVKISVRLGQEVKENQTVVILSSMKMEYTLKASDKGFIKSVKVKEGEKVSADQELVEISKSL